MIPIDILILTDVSAYIVLLRNVLSLYGAQQLNRGDVVICTRNHTMRYAQPGHIIV